MTKVLRLTLAVRIFEQLAAEAEAANIPSVELARRFIAARYELGVATAGCALSRRDRDLQSTTDLLREGEATFLRAIDGYGRIVQTLGKIFATAEQRAAIEKNLEIVGDGIALLRELLDQVEASLPPVGRARATPRRRIPNAANDDRFSA